MRREPEGADPDEESRIRRHAPLVYAVLKRLAAPPSLREDLLQEGFLGLLEALRGYDPTRGARFSTYAVPRIWGRMRHLARRAARLAAREEIRAPEFWAGLMDPVERLHARADWEAAFGVLSPEEATLVRLHLFNRVPETKLAQVLGVSQSTVSRRLRRALLTLHQQLTATCAQSKPGPNRH